MLPFRAREPAVMPMPALLLLPLALAASTSDTQAAAAKAPYTLTTQWSPGGAGGWDYLAVDTDGKRLFVTRGDHVAVLDLASGKEVGQVGPTSGVHGVALAPKHGHGYASNGRADNVLVFDLATLKVVKTIALAGKNPDAILYDESSDRVFAFNGKSHDASVIDAAKDEEVATIALSGKPEFAVADGAGRVYVNIEDRAELVALDARAAKVTATWKLPDCEEPTGLALDRAHHRLFSVCQNGHLLVTDAADGKHIATLPIGQGPDGVVFDPELGRAVSSNGQDGTLTVIQQKSADDYEVLGNVPTKKSARTIALDPASHRLFLSAAEFDPPAKPGERPTAKADSFRVLVLTP